MKRDVYLHSVSLEKAQEVIDDVFHQSSYLAQSETIAVKDSLHRITFDSVYARLSSPSYNASAMDGIATSSFLTEQATETNPVTIDSDHYIEVNTGNVIPLPFDTVIKIEDINFNNDRSITIIKSHALFQNIRPIGEDIARGDMIVPNNTEITAVMISALLAGGINHINVIKKPRFAIIPTGDEIITDSTKMKKGNIIDSNSYFLKNALLDDGIDGDILDVIKDEYLSLEQAVLNATKQYDCVLIGAGSSAGSKDYASDVVRNNGTLNVHGVSIKPGKPTIIGTINNVIVIGVPGYPVSTYITYLLLIRRLNLLMLHQPQRRYQQVQATLTKKVYSSLKNEEYVRVKLGHVHHKLIATPLSRGAGITMSLVQADGFVIVDRLREGYQIGDEVDVMLPSETILDVSNTLVSIGSHDIALDVINDMMSQNHYHLASSHLGSFSGVLAMKNHEAHIAPVHILHRNGTYNEHLISQYLNEDYVLVEGISRTQCLLVKKGNPKKIQGIHDLTKDDITFVNRQKGSGTRILLDHLLNKHRIDPTNISGYPYELPTHTTVAASVNDDRYDVGLGVVSVAKLYDLDYIEVCQEHYDFLVHKDTLQLDSFKQFISILQSDELKDRLQQRGGYQFDQPGRIKI